jgi:hypothetical protein
VLNNIEESISYLIVCFQTEQLFKQWTEEHDGFASGAIGTANEHLFASDLRPT